MADAYDGWDDSGESGAEDDPTEKTVTFKPSYVLIAIDTDKSMFVKDGFGKSPFIHCLKACYEMANSLILTSRGSLKGPLGIVLANNKLTHANFVEFEHSIPDTIKLLKDLKEQTNEELQAKYERTEDFDLADFFLLCKNKLFASKGEAYKRNLVYITNDENPVKSDAKLKFKTINEAQKFISLEISLHLFSYKLDFDNDLFYSEVLKACNSSSVKIIWDFTKFSDDLTKFVKHKYRKYRSKFYPFKGNTELYVEVVKNNFVQYNKFLKNLFVTRDTQKEVKKSFTRNVATEYSFEYRKSEPPLKFNLIEKENLKETNLPIGYTLVCVGEETYREGWIIKPPEVIEKHYQETDLIFESFWQFCKDKSRCLICLKKLKKSGDVRIVEMTPKFINNTYMFLVRTLPFALEINYPRLIKSDITFNEKEEAAMSDLVDTLTIDYNPHQFNNPIDCKREAYVKSELLEASELEEVSSGFPADEEIDKKIVFQTKKLLRLHLLDEAVAPKRASRAQTGSTSKRVKKEVKKSE